jgi:hypothetical protein
MMKTFITTLVLLGVTFSGVAANPTKAGFGVYGLGAKSRLYGYGGAKGSFFGGIPPYTFGGFPYGGLGGIPPFTGFAGKGAYGFPLGRLYGYGLGLGGLGYPGTLGLGAFGKGATFGLPYGGLYGYGMGLGGLGGLGLGAPLGNLAYGTPGIYGAGLGYGLGGFPYGTTGGGLGGFY